MLNHREENHARIRSVGQGLDGNDGEARPGDRVVIPDDSPLWDSLPDAFETMSHKTPDLIKPVVAF